jgi:hypothetical protein
VVEQLLLVLKIAFVILLYLFIWRVIRVATRDLRAGQESMVLPPASQPRRRRRRSGRLVVVHSPQLREGLEIELGRELTAGREDGLDIALPGDGYASVRHARFLYGDEADAVQDLGSTNGTYLNRKKVSGPVPVRRGDRLQVGRTVLEVAK